MKDVNKYSLYLIAIVGIVAIVGIWMMVSGTSKLLTTGTSGDSELVADKSSGEGDLAGQAYTSGACTDSDATSIYDTNQLLTKSTITWKKKPYTDYCNPKATPNYIYEYICKNGKMTTWGFNCKTLGENYECKDGACEVCQEGLVSITCVTETSSVFPEEKWISSVEKHKGKDCKISEVKTGCGDDESTCKDGAGCCYYVPNAPDKCEGDTLIQESKNPCTGDVKIVKTDCLSLDPKQIPDKGKMLGEVYGNGPHTCYTQLFGKSDASCRTCGTPICERIKDATDEYPLGFQKGLWDTNELCYYQSPIGSWKEVGKVTGPECSFDICGTLTKGEEGKYMVDGKEFVVKAETFGLNKASNKNFVDLTINQKNYEYMFKGKTVLLDGNQLLEVKIVTMPRGNPVGPYAVSFCFS